MLLQSRNLRVLGLDRCAQDTRETNFASVAFKGTVDESIDHSLDILGGFGVGECLIGGGLLQTVGIGDLALTLGGGCIAQKTENRICL